MLRLPGRATQLLLAALIATVAAACDDDASARPLEACAAGTELTASAGTQPVFDWSPDCAATHLLVTDQASGDTLWLLAPYASGGTIRSGHRYGTSSPTHRSFPGYEPVPLEEGRAYVVSLFTGDRPTLTLVGQRSFSPEIVP